MARKGKWIDEFPPDAPIVDVAASAIEARLDQVGIYLGLSADRPQSEIENVHQLRVYTRRGAAALELFAPLLPPRRLLWMAETLRRARKAAGSARDLDVLAARLDALAADHASVTWTALTKQIRVRRAAAQSSIVKCRERFVAKKFRDRAEQLVDRVRLRSKVDRLTKPTYLMAGRRALRALTYDFFAAADADLAELQSLHAFRIAGKQLRYGIEIYAAAFAKGLRKDIYPIVQELQDKLGAVNDLGAGRDFLAVWQAAPEDADVAEALRILIERSQHELPAAQQAFNDWWRPGLKADLRRKFSELLDIPPSASTLRTASPATG